MFTSAPVNSQILATALIKEIFVAKKEFEACFIISAVLILVKTISELYHNNRKITELEVDQFFYKYSKFHGIVVPYLFGHLWLKRQIVKSR